MSAPRPYLFCPTLDHQKTVIRMLYELGYNGGGKDLAAMLTEIDDYSMTYAQYPYVGTSAYGNRSIDWIKSLPPTGTLVNSGAHMRQYLKRRMVLTPGGPSA